MILRRAFVRRRFASVLPDSIPFAAEQIAVLPKWLQFYAPVIEQTQEIILSIHDFGGLPLWASISCLTIVVR
jgi:hypothetical protein